MSGGYGADGRGGNRGQGYGGQGYGDQGYGDQGYGEPDYDERGRPRRRPGTQPSWDDPEARPGQQRGGQPGYRDRAGRGQGPGQPYGGRDQGYGQRDGRPDPWAQGGAPQYPRGGQQPGRRGADPGWQDPAGSGYDPRGTGSRRADAGYPGGGGQGRGDSWPGQGDYQGQGGDSGRDSGFLPGFGGEESYDQGGRGRGARYPGEYSDYPGETGYADDRGGRRGRRGRDRDDQRGGGGGDDDWDDGGDGRRRRGPVRRLAPWIALLVILTPLVIGGLYIYKIYENKYHPADYAGPGSGSVTVQVKSGDTAFSLGPRLQSLGVVASARALELAAEHSTTTTATSPGLEAGFYKLHMHMQASLAWAALLNPKDRVQLTVTIPEGKRTSQVIAILAKDTSIPASDFQQVINNPAQLGLPSYAQGKVEGFLFPATYTIQPNSTALQILQAMVQRYGVEAQQANLTAAARRVGLTPEEVIIRASMVQAEGGVVSDYPKIARVIINRLQIGMKLQFDSVLLYGLNAYGINVTQKQIDTPGPYNDFQHAGLPPGPISNPGDSAIQAVLHPASGPWLYFLTKTGGASEFSATPLAGQ